MWENVSTLLHYIIDIQFQFILFFNLALIAEIIRRHHYCESVTVVGGEFKPIDFRHDADDSSGNVYLSGMHFDNGSVGQLGIHRSPPNSVVQEESASGATNRPLERIRRGYRLSSKCWD